MAQTSSTKRCGKRIEEAFKQEVAWAAHLSITNLLLDAPPTECANLARHVTNLRGFGLPVVVGVNHFYADTDAEHAKLKELCRERLDVEAITCRHWAEGGAGAEDLARAVVALAKSGAPKTPNFVYPEEAKLYQHELLNMLLVQKVLQSGKKRETR